MDSNSVPLIFRDLVNEYNIKIPKLHKKKNDIRLMVIFLYWSLNFEDNLRLKLKNLDLK